MTSLKGGALRPNAGIEADYINAVLPLIRRMCDETRKVLEGVFAEHPMAAMDSNPAPQGRMALNALREKYKALFAKLARKSTKRMIDRTLRYSAVALGQSLRELSEQFELKVDYLTTPRMQEVISAATNEAADLIKLIPQKYLADVSGQVMRSISTGQGMKDLVPYLREKYEGNIRHARLVAMDQTRKAFATINAERLQAAGIKSFTWIHVGGSQEPRKNHVAMNGKTFSYADPPVIGEMYGQEVRGIPGQLPNCRCLARPVLNFGD